MIEENETISVTALGRSQEFAGVEDLAGHVAEVLEHRHGIFDSLELACIAELARQNGAERPRVEEIARRTSFFEPQRAKGPTPLDARIDEAAAKAQEAEAALAEANEAWRAAAREADLEYRQRLHKAAENPARLIGAQRWAEGRQAQVRALEAEFRAADDARRRARARANALELAQGRWRYDEAVRLSVPGKAEPLTLAAFAAYREREGR